MIEPGAEREELVADMDPVWLGVRDLVWSARQKFACFYRWFGFCLLSYGARSLR
jgi:hypothetical protein